MDESIRVRELRLGAHFAVPATNHRALGLVLCHGLPDGPRGATSVALTYPDLADRIARESGWVVLTYNARGTGTSDGDFSVSGWLDDARAAVRALDARPDVRGVWIAGFGHGGTFALCAAARDDRIRGVATIAASRSFAIWTGDARELLTRARDMGMIRTEGFPRDVGGWAREVADLDAVRAAGELGGRPLLVIHGVDDEDVPVADARALADAAGASAELRLVSGAGHRLRHDPRAVATLLGWLDRQEP